jgi:hypothetical protein
MCHAGTPSRVAQLATASDLVLPISAVRTLQCLLHWLQSLASGQATCFRGRTRVEAWLPTNQTTRKNLRFTLVVVRNATLPSGAFQCADRQLCCCYGNLEGTTVSNQVQMCSCGEDLSCFNARHCMACAES